MAKRKSLVMQERASGLVLGWDRSPFEGEDCDGLGVIHLGAVLPLDFPLGLDPFPLPFFPLDAYTPLNYSCRKHPKFVYVIASSAERREVSSKCASFC